MTHMKQINKLDFSGQDIYVGIDTGKKNWKVTILLKDFEHKTKKSITAMMLLMLER